MKTGRPPIWNPVASLGRAVWTDVLPLASKGRVVFPVIVRDRVGWLADRACGLLAIIEADRHAELVPWEQRGEIAISEIRRAIDAVEEHHKDELALAAMDRFVRLSVDSAGRTVLPGSLASHLDAEASASVRIVMRGARLWLWSERRWQAQRPRRIRMLENLAPSAGAALVSGKNPFIRPD